MNDVYRAALRYARKGMPVFPCGADKRPMTVRGFYAATTDETTIRSWFDVQAPPLIGIPTGEMSGSWVLDVDRKNDIDGSESLHKLTEQYGALPDCPISLTPSGGMHYVWRYTRQVKTSSGQLGPGLDVRGDGGYYIAPPSGADGRRYEWEASSGADGLVEAPPWLAELVAPPAPRERRPYQEPTDSDRKRALSALRAITYDGSSRDEWLEIGMAYRAAGGDFESFDAWCSEQPGYHAQNVAKEWESFSVDGGITPGTLYYYAQQHGWRDGPELRFGGGTSEVETIELEEARSKSGDFLGYKPTLANVVAVLERHESWHGKIQYNELTGFAELRGKGGARELDDATIHEIRVWLDTGLKWHSKPSRNVVFDAVEVVSRRAAYHPVREYLSGLQWDGVERLPFWLDDVCGVPRTVYTMAVASKLLIGAVARIREPGCKLDTMVVLIGEQGVLKSSLVDVLSRSWHVDTPIPIGSKDAYQTLMGCWFYEFAELASFHGKEVERLKAFFSSRYDTFRPSYGRTTVKKPRGCVFVATTNDSEIFHDSTGARRFWPVEIQSVNLPLLRSIIDQLWAEAVVQYQAGEPWYMEGEAAELAAAAAEAHHASDPWEERLAGYVLGKDRVTVVELLDYLEIDMSRRSKSDSMRVTRIMRDRLRWKKQTVRAGGMAAKGYRRTSVSVTGLRLVTPENGE